MIESFKLPTITPETISDSVCNFTDEYGGLPLKSCSSLISGYQEGQGVPSPSNPRNLVPFSSATLTANSDTYTFSFGREIYRGEIDWQLGVVKGYEIISVFDGSADENWLISGTGNFYNYSLGSGYLVADTVTCNRLESIHRQPDADHLGIYNNTRYIQVRPSADELDVTAFKTWLSNNNLQVAYELSTPITIPLGGIQLLTQQGNNSFFADCGNSTVEWLKVN